MWRVYVRWTGVDGTLIWKFLCVLYDNEARGWLERLFTSQQIEFKIEKIPTGEEVQNGDY